MDQFRDIFLEMRPMFRCLVKKQPIIRGAHPCIYNVGNPLGQDLKGSLSFFFFLYQLFESEVLVLGVVPP